jgi:hypothetical protein
MANSIAYVASYMEMVDRLYKAGASTSILEANQAQFKSSDLNAATIYLKEITMVGLGAYNRGSGYSATGDATVVWTPYTFTMDRARKFIFDAIDEKDSKTTAAELAAEFYRTQVVPEIDAYRFEKICSLAGLDVSANLTSDTVLAAIDTGVKTLDDANAPKDRIIFVSNECYMLLKQSGEFFNVRLGSAMDKALNREIMTLDGMPIIRPSADVFKTNFDFDAGASGSAGGFAAASGAKNLNFIITERQAITAVVKHMEPKLINPAQNADGDGYILGLRVLHDLFIPTNKLPGVYCHSKS